MPQNKAGVGTCNIPERNRRRHGVWFWLRCDFCSFVGFGNAFRTVKNVPRKCGHFPVSKTNARDGHPLWVPGSSPQNWDRNTAPFLEPRLSSIPSPASELFLGSCPPVFPEGLPASQPDPIANQNSISTNDKVVRFTATEPEDMTHAVPAR